ncbi:hypothetical protein BH09SUM1_BH09SUM1_10720 [soil metagenome]
MTANRLVIAILWAALWAVLSPTVAAAQVYGGQFASPEERDAVTKAEIAYDHRDYELAAKLSREAVKRFPESLEARRTLVSVALPMNFLAEVLAESDPDTVPKEQVLCAHYMRAWAGILNGDFQYAQAEIRRAIIAGGNSRLEVRRVDIVADRMAGTESGESLVRRAEQLVKDFPGQPLARASYLNTLGRLGFGSRRHRAAAEEALALPTKNPEIYVAAVGIRNEAIWVDPRDNLEIIDTGLREFPQSTALALLRIQTLRQLGLTQDALSYTRGWIQRAPNHGDFHVREMELLCDLNRWDDAVSATLAMKQLRYQPGYIENAAFQVAQFYHYAGERKNAIDSLNYFLKTYPNSFHRGEAEIMRSRLSTAKPEAEVRFLPGMTYLQQRGNYCGPATVSVLLQYWGVTQSQEEIAASVYTGVAGTPPQVLHNFAHTAGLGSTEFRASEEVWKQLLDKGYPILWLQMLGSRGAHYRLIVGYDDVMEQWLVQDPNNFQRTAFRYDDIKDTWIFPDLGRSILFFPQERANDPLIKSLKPTTRLFVTNWILYVATGSNLFVSLFPAIFVNAACAALMAWLIAVLLRAISFPRAHPRMGHVFLAILGLIVPLNLLIGLLRWSEAVSLLLAFHLALLSLIPLLVMIFLLRGAIGDYFHPRESAGLCIMVGFVWISISFVDSNPWQWALPVGIFAIAMPLVLAPRRHLIRAQRAAKFGDAPRALARIAPIGSGRSRYYAAMCLEIENLLAAGRYEELFVVLNQMTKEDERLPGRVRDALNLVTIVALALTKPNRPPAYLADYLRRPNLAKQHRTLADGVAFYLAQRHGEDLTATPPQVDALLSAINEASERRLVGLSPSGSTNGRPITQAIFMLTLTGAIRRAQSAGDESRAKGLLNTWGARYALTAHLIEEMEGFFLKNISSEANHQLPNGEGARGSS